MELCSIISAYFRNVKPRLIPSFLLTATVEIALATVVMYVCVSKYLFESVSNLNFNLVFPIWEETLNYLATMKFIAVVMGEREHMRLRNLLYCKKHLSTFIFVMFLVSATVVTMINVTSASPDTYFYVDPPEIRDVQPGGNFTITINITDAPPSYAWEVYLSWNPDLLELVQIWDPYWDKWTNVMEGDFLDRRIANPFPPPDYMPLYDTTLAYTPLDEANLNGEILITCTLIGALPMSEWASGNGWLFTLNFTVQAKGSTLLNLFDTRLWDHTDAEGYPASTYYRNEDGFFSNVAPPVADFTYTSPVTNTPVNFTSTSYDTDGWITSWEWDLNGDGTIDAVDENTTYTYTTEGNYTVTLNVTDNDGLTSTKIVTLTVFREVIHDVAITSVTPSITEAVLGEEVMITVVAKNKGSEAETFNVTVYYDNTAIEMQNVTNLLSGSNTTLTFTWYTTGVQLGPYTISANASLVEGETQTEDNTFIDGTVTILSPPVAKFTEDATTVLTGVAIHFDASDSSDPDGFIVSYFWDFGDGANATGVTVDHAYSDNGNYTVTLTVIDNDDLTNSTSAVKTVLNRPPVALFNESAETVDTGVAITFDASASYDPDGSIVSYAWDFGDGADATGVTVNHAYDDDDIYTVTLTVTDDDGATASTSAVKTVSNRPPVASFTEDATTVNTGEVIHFNASESYDPDGFIVSYFWDFGDGANATGVTVDHAYSDNGNYTVTLTVTDNDGATSSLTATKTVKAPTGWPLAWYGVISLGITALTLIALYVLYRRRKG